MKQLTSVQACTQALNDGNKVIDKEGIVWKLVYDKYCTFDYHDKGDVYNPANINNILLPATLVEPLTQNEKEFFKALGPLLTKHSVALVSRNKGAYSEVIFQFLVPPHRSTKEVTLNRLHVTEHDLKELIKE